MSTPADTTTPPAAPAGGTPPAAPVDEGLKFLFDAEEQPSSPKREEGLSLAEAIQPDETPNPEPKPEDKPEVTPKPEDKKEAAPPPPPKDEEPPIPARRKRVEPTPPPAPDPEPEPTPAPAPKPDELDGIELSDEEREQLALAEYAEKTGDPKYAGLPDKLKRYIKAHAKFVDEERKADPDAVFDSTNPRYQAFLAKNKPAMSAAEARTLDRQRIADETRAKVAPELNQVKDEIFRRDAEPQIRGSSNKFIASVVNESAPDLMREVLSKEGVAKAKEKFPFEFSVIEDTVSAAAADMEEFMRLTTVNPATGSPVRRYDANSAQHQRIVAFVDQACDDFAKSGSKELIKDGKRFLTRAQYYAIKDPAKRAPYWTFSNEDIVARAGGIVKGVIKERLVAEEKRLEQMGFKRAAVTPPPVTPPPPPSGTPPAPRGSTPPASSGAAPDESAFVKKATSILFGE